MVFGTATSSHSKLGTTPFQVSPVIEHIFLAAKYLVAMSMHALLAKKQQLDYHTSLGIFMSFCATDSNLYYINDIS